MLTFNWQPDEQPNHWRCIVRKNGREVYSAGGCDFGSASPHGSDPVSKHRRALYEKEILDEYNGDFVA